MRKEKIRETDYQQSERPRTRLAQFFDIFRHNFVELIKLALLQTVFNMPLLATLVTFHLFVRNATSLNSLMTVFIITGFALLISMISTFTGLTGSFYCLKNICYAEGEFASSSFFVGLRDEWKKGLLTGFIVGISFAATVIGSFFFYYYLGQINTSIAGFGIAILTIQAIIVLMIAYYTISQVLIYENKYRHVLKNAFLMVLMRFHINLLLFIIHPGIVIALFLVVEMASNLVVLIIFTFLTIAVLLFFISIFHLMWTVHIVGAFDKFINKENYPEFYRKGLYKEG